MKHTFGPEPCEACRQVENNFSFTNAKTILSKLDWDNITMVGIVAFLFLAIGYSKLGGIGIPSGMFATILFMCAFDH